MKSSGHEWLDVLHEIIAGVGVHFHHDGLGQVQAEDAQNGLGVYHMTAGAQVYVIGIHGNYLLVTNGGDSVLGYITAANVRRV